MENEAPEMHRDRRRSEPFAERIESCICREIPADTNPYVAQRWLWHGYDMTELMRHADPVDVGFLLLTGEMPRDDQKRLLNSILVALAHPGPRHSATRAVMAASVSKAKMEHFLPIGLGLMGGEQLGVREVQESMVFLKRNLQRVPEEVAAGLLGRRATCSDGEALVPGFGLRFGDVDALAVSMAGVLLEDAPEESALGWAACLCEALAGAPASWRVPGVAAAAFVDLGFSPPMGAGLFQWAAGPGLLAHGLEMMTRPLTALPFVGDEHYHYEGADHD